MILICQGYYPESLYRPAAKIERKNGTATYLKSFMNGNNQSRAGAPMTDSISLMILNLFISCLSVIDKQTYYSN
jgi:hypothetical protein